MPTYLRHAPRHLQRTLSDYVKSYLDELGWLGPDVPFGTSPVTYYARRLRENEMNAITGNMVAVTFGEESDDALYELGGGLAVVSTTMYLDVIAVSDPIGLALASDVKDLLAGRVPGRSRFVVLRDYTADPAGSPVTDYQIEIVQTSRQRPGMGEQQFWQAIIAELEMTFPGSE